MAIPVEDAGGLSIRNRSLRALQSRYAVPTIVIPSAGLAVAAGQALTTGVGRMEVGLLFGMYALTMAGVSVGLHRHLAHRAFQARPAVRALLAVLGSMAGQGPVIGWVSNHRRHHSHSDTVGDPHSPHVTEDGKRHRGRLRGFWHAYIGWMLGGELTNALHFSTDLLRDPIITRVNRLYPLWLLLGLAVPTAIGGLLASTWAGAFQGLVWGGLAPMALSQHATWGIASLAHIFGTRPFDTGERDQSRNNLLAALPTLGDAWHNNHHAFPSAAICGFEWWQVDPSGWVIRGLEALGLAWDVRRVPPGAARLARRRGAAPAGPSAGRPAW